MAYHGDDLPAWHRGVNKSVPCEDFIWISYHFVTLRHVGGVNNVNSG